MTREELTDLLEAKFSFKKWNQKRKVKARRTLEKYERRLEKDPAAMARYGKHMGARGAARVVTGLAAGGAAGQAVGKVVGQYASGAAARGAAAFMKKYPKVGGRTPNIAVGSMKHHLGGEQGKALGGMLGMGAGAALGMYSAVKKQSKDHARVLAHTRGRSNYKTRQHQMAGEANLAQVRKKRAAKEKTEGTVTREDLLNAIIESMQPRSPGQRPGQVGRVVAGEIRKYQQYRQNKKINKRLDALEKK